LEEREDKLVWMQKRKRAEQHMVKRTGKCSKRERERHAHREEKHSKREG